jgi:hypothetical protein
MVSGWGSCSSGFTDTSVRWRSGLDFPEFGKFSIRWLAVLLESSFLNYGGLKSFCESTSDSAERM